MSRTALAPIGGLNEINEQFLAVYPLARRAAGVRSAVAVARASVPSADHDDLEQEAVVACWRTLPNYDPARASLTTYIECVVATRISSVVRASHRRRMLRPLDLALNHCADQAFSRHELRIDVEGLLRLCSDDERRLALLLMENSPSQVGRMLGIARSTVYEHLKLLRVRFRKAGFGPRHRERR
jgi:RNA polymerase sigma factor (sigma-70 family)